MHLNTYSSIQKTSPCTVFNALTLLSIVLMNSETVSYGISAQAAHTILNKSALHVDFCAFPPLLCPLDPKDVLFGTWFARCADIQIWSWTQRHSIDMIEMFGRSLVFAGL